jgi:hypothetical protein
MQNIRPLTVEEFLVAGVSMKICMACSREKAHNESSWVYYRDEQVPKALCEYCFVRIIERGTVAVQAAFSSPHSAACHEPQDAHRIIGLPQRTPAQLEKVFADFRGLSKDEIHELGMQVPSRASLGDDLELFGPVFWGAIFWCLKWLREIHDMPLRFLFVRWAKLPQVLIEKCNGTQYDPWRARVMEFAHGEFLDRYNVLLSDAIEDAHAKMSSKKTTEAKRKVLESCKAAVCGHSPPDSLVGAKDDLTRFMDYMDSWLARV